MATQKQITELLTKMNDERETLLTSVASFSENDAESNPPEGEGEAGWSIKEQLSHLAEMEVSYRAWVQRALVEERPDVSKHTATEPIAVPQSEAHSIDLQSHITQLRRLREQTLDLIKTISPDGYERILYTNAFGELTVLQCLRSYYRHDRMHAAQIEGRQSDYVPRWADGQQEPKRTNRLR
tara:strand:- start:279 stop:824 length:546 start_codon:yes stop_codon:yes gene_type:complete